VYGSPELMHHFHPVLRSCALGRRPRRTVVGTGAYVLFRDSTPYSFRGMRLDRFDAPLVRSLRLLDRIYFGGRGDAAADATSSAPTLAGDGTR